MKNILFSLIAVLAGVFGLSGATVDFLRLESPYLKGAEDVVVICPDTLGNTRTYPTVYLLNGYGGDHLSWLHICHDLPAMADRYGFIFVCPDGRDSWYWDSPIDPDMQMESFITETLVQHIDSVYPTDARPGQRGIAGLSMGGQGALWLALRHQDLWKNVSAISGGVDIRPFSAKWSMSKRIGDKDKNPQAWEDFCLLNLIPALKPGQLNIMLDCGVDDFFQQVNATLDRELDSLKIPHDFVRRPGGHTQAYWRNALPFTLVFFDHNFKSARCK